MTPTHCHRYRLITREREPVLSSRTRVPMEFSQWDFARGMAGCLSTEEKPVLVEDLETKTVTDWQGQTFL